MKRLDVKKLCKANSRLRAFFLSTHKSENKRRISPFVFCPFLFDVFPFSCVERSLYLRAGASRRPYIRAGLIVNPYAQAVISPACPKVGTQLPRCQLNSNQQTKMEWDIELHPISSPILKPVFASRKLAYKLRLWRWEKSSLPDNNQITSCRRLDVSFQLGRGFLPSLDVRGEFSWVSPGWASTVHFNLHSEGGRSLGQADAELISLKSVPAWSTFGNEDVS